MDNYFNVLNAFIDKKDSYYSIHQIGKSLGAGEHGDIQSGFPMSLEYHCMFVYYLGQKKPQPMRRSGST